MNRFDKLSLLGLTFLLGPLGAIAQVAPADQGIINHHDSNAVARRETARPVRMTVPPNAATAIAVATLPNATCSMHPEGDTTQSVKLFADDEGMVRFHVNPAGESDMAAPLVLDCAADGVAQTFPLALRPNSTPTVDMPAPAAEVRKPRPGAFVQPALTEDEAATLSAEELATRGYPRRPDAKEWPKAHATWLKGVTQPMTFVPPKQVVNPGRTHGPTCCVTNPFSSNWSGFQLEGQLDRSVTYTEVQGEWYVPDVAKPQPNLLPAYSAFWIGLDGYNTPVPVPNGTSKDVLVQAGTEQDAQTLRVWPGFNFAITTYYAWTEFLPQDPYEIRIQNFVVAPGDLITCLVWIGPSYYTADLSGPYAWFAIRNITRGEYTYFSQSRSYNSGPNGEKLLPGASGTAWNIDVPGYEAEWIMERPTIYDNLHPNGYWPALANYGQVEMTGAFAKLNNSSTWVPANGQNTLPLVMVSGVDNYILSSPYSDLICAFSPTRLCTIRADGVLFGWNAWQ